MTRHYPIMLPIQMMVQSEVVVDGDRLVVIGNDGGEAEFSIRQLASLGGAIREASNDYWASKA